MLVGLTDQLCHTEMANSVCSCESSRNINLATLFHIDIFIEIH